MRITNISDYFGADNVIAREIIEGDQVAFQFKLGEQDFSGYTFEVDTELFNSSVTKRGSSIKIDSFTKATENLVNGGKFELPNTYEGGGIRLDQNDPTLGNLIIPSDLLSKLTTLNAPANVTTPFIVAMSVTLNSNSTINIKQSFRMLWIVRYRPMA